MLHITRACRSEAEWLSTRLRAADNAEVMAATGDTPVVVLPQSFDISKECFTIRGHSDGDPIGMFGVVGVGWKRIQKWGEPVRSIHLGTPWLLGTDELVDYSIPFLRVSRSWSNRLGWGFDAIFGYVYAENTTHIRWLKWSGFDVSDEPVNHGPFNALFYPFAKRTSSKCVSQPQSS